MPRGLPPGLTINPSTGAISGTPTRGGTYTFVVQAQDSTGARVRGEYDIEILALEMSVTTPDAYKTEAYTGSVSASGGTGPYTYSVATGTLPTGISLNASTGALTGTVDSGATTQTVTFRAVDSLGIAGEVEDTITVYALPQIVFNQPSDVEPPSADSDPATAWSFTLSTTGGKSPFTYSTLTDSIAGVHGLNTSTGEVSGTWSTTPSGATGRSSASYRVTDANGKTSDSAVREWNHYSWVNILDLGVTPTVDGASPSQFAPRADGASWRQNLSGDIPQGVPVNRVTAPSLNAARAIIILPAGYYYGSKTRTTVEAHNIDSGGYVGYVDLVQVGDLGASPPASVPHIAVQTGLTLAEATSLITSVTVDGTGSGTGTAEWRVHVLACET